jgi:hypothetical protein
MHLKKVISKTSLTNININIFSIPARDHDVTASSVSPAGVPAIASLSAAAEGLVVT